MKTITSTSLTLAAAIAAGVLSTAAFTTSAEARPSTKSFTCEGAKRFIRNNGGAVVMNTTSPRVYRRFVAYGNQCGFGYARRYSVPTKSGSCQLLYCDPNKRRTFDN